MTGEETKTIKEKFEKRFVWMSRSVGLDEDKNYVLGEWIGTWADEVSLKDVWQFIESEIITPYEKQLEQVERVITGKDWYCKDEIYCDWYKCPNCTKTMIYPDAAYCPECGVKLNWSLFQNTQTK